MAITPVKTGTTPPPPAKKTDTKLAAQFNMAATTGSQMVEKKPAFYTPLQGSFKEPRKISGKTVNARLDWKVSETQPKVTDNVNIKGTVTIDWKDKRGRVAYTVDADKSFITKDGAVVYSVQGILYRSSYNLFKSIKANVMSALKEVTGNTKNFKDKYNNITPVSLASAKLTRALNAVGEQNIRYGIGLGGAGKEIREALNSALMDGNNTEFERRAVALAATTAGVKVSYDGQIAPKPAKDANGEPIVWPMMFPDEVRGLNVETGVEALIDDFRRATDGNVPVMMETADQQALVNRVIQHYQNPDNLRGVATAYADLFATPGVLHIEGINQEITDYLTGAIGEYMMNGLQNLPRYPARIVNGLRAAGVDRQMFQPVLDLIEKSPIIHRTRLTQYVAGLANLVNVNATAWGREQQRKSYMKELLGNAMRQFKEKDEF